MLIPLTPKSNIAFVQHDPEHIARVMAERRRLCIGEGYRVREGDVLATFHYPDGRRVVRPAGATS